MVYNHYKTKLYSKKYIAITLKNKNLLKKEYQTHKIFHQIYKINKKIKYLV